MRPILVRASAAVLALLLAACAVGCGSGSRPEPETVTYPEYATDKPPLNADMAAIAEEIDSLRVDEFTETLRKTAYVKVSIRGYGDFVIRLRSDIAPLTVENFSSLVASGFYDGLTVHRVIKGFVIQMGDPKGDGSGGSEKTVMGEFSYNGVRNDLSHIPGVVTMARKGDQYDSATSQFMVCNADASATLDGGHAAFGYVVAGMNVVLTVSETEVTLGSGEISRPVEPIVIEKICFVAKK